MTKEDREDKLVVTPLCDWFEKQEAGWKLSKPKFSTSARGWDIEAWRKNEYLLIEAKYIFGPSIAALAGLVAAPLAKRVQHRKYRSWCCWAIGIKPPRNMYQVLFDYTSRNSEFWKHYGEDHRMKYIFFVQEGEVMRIPFAAFLRMTKLYADRADGETLAARRRIADDLLSTYLNMPLKIKDHRFWVSRLKAVLDEIVGGPTKRWLELPGRASVARAYLKFKESSQQIRLEVYPADILKQAKAFYTRLEATAGVLSLRDKGWDVVPNFHFGYMAKGLVWTTVDAQLERYVDYWREHIDGTKAKKREEWEEFWRELVKQRFAKEDEKAQFDQHLPIPESGSQQPRDPALGASIPGGCPMQKSLMTVTSWLQPSPRS
jgi:hypothetical protein